jgi:hypothetical protein
MWRPETFGSPILEALVDVDGRITLKDKLLLMLNHTSSLEKVYGYEAFLI